VLLWLLYRRGSAGTVSSADRPRRGAELAASVAPR
jgi:hypothetical protein